MRNLVFILLLIPLISNCQFNALNLDDEELGFATVTLSTAVSDEYCSIDASGEVTDIGTSAVTERGMVISESPNPTTADTKIINGSGIGSFNTSYNSASANTGYYIRYYAINGSGTAYSNQISETTLSNPGVTHTSVTNITATSADINFTFATGGNTITNRGVQYGTSSPPTENNENSAGSSSPVTINLTGLTASTTYYFKDYIDSDCGGRHYAGEESFETTAAISLPTVTTAAATGILINGASVGGNVTDDGGGTVSARGICWHTSPNPDVFDNVDSQGSGTGTFLGGVTSCDPNTTYYVRTYAENEAGLAYGNEISFTTGCNNFSAYNIYLTIQTDCGTVHTTSYANCEQFLDDYRGSCNFTGWSWSGRRINTIAIGYQMYLNDGSCDEESETKYGIINPSSTPGASTIIGYSSGEITSVATY
jgi:hypothetical protein